MALVKNSEHIVDITGYTAEGAGVARIDGAVVFIPCALIGERVEIRIVKADKSISYGKLIRVISPSAERVEPDCPLFPKCGGCDTRHMSETEEARFKAKRVKDALERIGGFENPCMEEIISAPSRIGYRNKCMFPVSEKDGRLVSGFFRAHSHDIVECDECRIQNPRANALRDTVVFWMEQYKIPAYDEASGKGSVRNIFIRCGDMGDMLCLVVNEKPKNTDKLVSLVNERNPNTNSILLNINTTRGNTLLGKNNITLYGDGLWRDTMCGFEFLISPLAFYQVNKPQAEKLYQKACGYADLSKDDCALDLYCGAGTITLNLAKYAGTVYGVEVVESAVENAKRNAELNGVKNVVFTTGDAGKAAQDFAKRALCPRVIVVDPPRKGLDVNTIDAILKMSPERLVYVSCDPATLARDAKILCQNGYELVETTPVDMFPGTRHVECVVLLCRI